MSRLIPLASVLDIFAFLFSNQWIGHWQKGWLKQQLATESKVPTTPAAKKPSHGKRFYQRIFSLRVTLWYLIFQRLNSDQTQAAVVVNLRAGGADRLGRKGAKKLSKRIKSAQTSSYNQARKRIPLELLQEALVHLSKGLLKLVGLNAQSKKEPAPAQRTRQLLDGSTLAMLKTPELAEDFPPATNQNGASDWCLMRIVVGFCARSGGVLSAIQGPIQESEQAMAWKLIQKALAFTIWIGDRNFGVWSVAAQAVRFQQDVVVRLTQARAAKLRGPGQMQSGEERLIRWSPSKADQAAPGTERQALVGRLIYVRICRNGKGINLWLFTTLPAQEYPIPLLVQWYGQRWQAELHFRSVKTQMKMTELKLGAPQIARIEFYAGLLAYTLVRAVMWSAGDRLEEKVKTLSFSQARRILLGQLQDWGRKLASAANGSSQWIQGLLEEVLHHTLPKRKKTRLSEVRRVRRRRLKFPPFTGCRAAANSRDMATKS